MTDLSIAQQMHQALTQRLAPDVLEVLDESAAHAGHAGANGDRKSVV